MWAGACRKKISTEVTGFQPDQRFVPLKNAKLCAGLNSMDFASTLEFASRLLYYQEILGARIDSGAKPGTRDDQPGQHDFPRFSTG